MRFSLAAMADFYQAHPHFSSYQAPTPPVVSTFKRTAPLWIDTDAGFDDLLAIGALASDEHLKLVTTTSGACETPAVGAARVAGLLKALGRDDVEVVAGLPAPSVEVAPWLATAREKMVAWAADLPRAAPSESTVADALARLDCPDGLFLGPLTNVAAALEGLDKETLDYHFGECVAMGGNKLKYKKPDFDLDQAPYNVPEFNFACDPRAARKVVGMMHDLAIVGLDACAADLDDVAAELAAMPGLLASIPKVDAYAVRCDPLAAFYYSTQENFDQFFGGLIVDGDTGVMRVKDHELHHFVGTNLRPGQASQKKRHEAYAGGRAIYVAWLKDALAKHP